MIKRNLNISCLLVWSKTVGACVISERMQVNGKYNAQEFISNDFLDLEQVLHLDDQIYRNSGARMVKKSVINMLHNYISGESESVPVLECKA